VRLVDQAPAEDEGGGEAAQEHQTDATVTRGCTARTKVTDSGFVKVEDRMEFEDRLLGLVREWMGSDDEVDYRRRVGHFAVVYEVVLDDDETWPALAAPPGFPPGETWISLSCSSRSDWINEALLREALDLVQGRRMIESDDDEDEGEDE
jgi:hypothetical protein